LLQHSERTPPLSIIHGNHNIARVPSCNAAIIISSRINGITRTNRNGMHHHHRGDVALRLQRAQVLVRSSVEQHKLVAACHNDHVTIVVSYTNVAWQLERRVRRARNRECQTRRRGRQRGHDWGRGDDGRDTPRTTRQHPPKNYSSIEAAGRRHNYKKSTTPVNRRTLRLQRKRCRRQERASAVEEAEERSLQSETNTKKQVRNNQRANGPNFLKTKK
jgi:hypothetical protein